MSQGRAAGRARVATWVPLPFVPTSFVRAFARIYMHHTIPHSVHVCERYGAFSVPFFCAVCCLSPSNLVYVHHRGCIYPALPYTPYASAMWEYTPFRLFPPGRPFRAAPALLNLSCILSCTALTRMSRLVVLVGRMMGLERCGSVIACKYPAEPMHTRKHTRA